MMRRNALLLAGGLALALSACGSGGPAPQPSQSSSAPVSTGPDLAPENRGEASAPAVQAPIDQSAAPSPALSASGPIACSTEIGPAAARKLVAQCIAVSPATHPPCNAANSCAMIRDEIARSCALLEEDAAKTPACSADAISPKAAADTIERYYSAINARDYGSAWILWGEDGPAGKTLQQFAGGFARTRHTHVDIGKVSDVEGGAGSLYVTVPVIVDAELDDGSRQHFTGSYDLRQINRGMGRSQGWHIMSAKLRPS